MKHQIAGFSLIELLLVIGIIGILVTLGFPAFTRYQYRVRLIDSHVAVKKALEEAFSAARSAPKAVSVSFSRDDGFFTICEDHDKRSEESGSDGIDGNDCKITETVVDLKTEVNITALKEGKNYGGADDFIFDNNVTEPIKIVFDPPYGDVRFLKNNGVFILQPEVDFYQFCLQNPSPLHSFVRIWKTGLIETGLDRQLMVAIEQDSSPRKLKETLKVPASDICGP